MNIQHYKQRLLDLEKTLSARIGQEADQGRGEFIDSAHDVGDASVADEVASEELTEAEHNSDVLQQVRDALDRVVIQAIAVVRRDLLDQLCQSPSPSPS